MRVGAVRAEAAHRVLRVAAPLVANHLRRRASPRPVIVEGRVHRERVELLNVRIGVERIFELAAAVDVLEEHSHAVLRHEAPARAALNADAGVEVKSILAIGPHVFERTGAFPRHAFRLRVRPETARAEDVVPVGDDAQRGKVQQVALERRSIERAAGDVRVQRVILRAAADPAPVRALRLNLVQEQIGMRLDFRRLETAAIADGAQQRRAADGNPGAGVDQPARGARRGAVRGVANGDAGRRARDGDGKVCGVEPAATRRELQVLDKREEAAAVDRAR